MDEEEKKASPSITDQDMKESDGIITKSILRRIIIPNTPIFNEYKFEMTLLIKLLGEEWCEQLDCEDTTVALSRILQKLQHIVKSPDLAVLIEKKLQE